MTKYIYGFLIFCLMGSGNASANPSIKELQNNLNAMNCGAGSADGVWGGKSNAAYTLLALQNNQRKLDCGNECLADIANRVANYKSKGLMCKPFFRLEDDVSLKRSTDYRNYANLNSCSVEDEGNLIWSGDCKTGKNRIIDWRYSKLTGKLVYHATQQNMIPKLLGMDDIIAIFIARYGVPQYTIDKDGFKQMCYGCAGYKIVDGVKRFQDSEYVQTMISVWDKSSGFKISTYRSNLQAKEYAENYSDSVEQSKNNSSRLTQPDSYNPKVIGRDSDGAIRVGCSGDATRNLILVYENNGIYTGPEWVSSTSLNETVREACKKRFGL